MSKITRGAQDFVGYEYKEVTAASDKLSLCLDCYENFGWLAEDTAPGRCVHGGVTVTLRRDRRIVNKAELTRLQRNFEACMEEIRALERAKVTGARVWALTVGIIGTALMACSVFAVTGRPPDIPACILFAVPAFLCWGAAPLGCKRRAARKTERINPIIEGKYEEIYALCERGHRLLPK